MSSNDLTLTRQALYELVWSKPMTHVARDFGTSVAPRGYWAQAASAHRGVLPTDSRLK
jgi:hypothetical protein